MRYDDACAQVGYDRQSYNAPAAEYKYFAYKNGESKEFNSMAEAKNFSSNTEKVQTNKEEVQKYHNERRALENKASEIWHNALREEYDYLPDAIYNLCYSKAYEDGHSAGYDEVANEMIDLADMAEKIMKETRIADLNK